MLSYPGLLLRRCNLYAWKDWVARPRLILYCKKQLLYNIFLVAVLDQRCLFLLLIFVLKLGCEIFIGLPFFFFFFSLHTMIVIKLISMLLGHVYDMSSRIRTI